MPPGHHGGPDHWAHWPAKFKLGPSPPGQGTNMPGPLASPPGRRSGVPRRSHGSAASARGPGPGFYRYYFTFLQLPSASSSMYARVLPQRLCSPRDPYRSAAVTVFATS